jgi:transcription-repair coupling factor (superfamily II helicase)
MTTSLAPLLRALSGAGPLDLIGADGPFVAYLLSALASQDERPSILVCPTPEAARRLFAQLSFFRRWFAGQEGDLLLIPDLEWSPYGDFAPDRRLITERLRALFRLHHGPKPKIVLLTAEALLHRVLPRSYLSSATELLQKNEELDRDRFAQVLVAAGYLNAPVVEDPGTFHLRGGRIDVFSPFEEHPARIELYGDLVESIRLFDPKTQRTTREVEELLIGPAREERLSPEGAAKAKANLRAIADEVNLPTLKTRLLLDDIERRVPFFGVESFAPAYHDPWEPLFAYLGENARCYIEEPSQVRRAILGAERREEDAYLARRSRGEVCLPYNSFFLGAEEVLSQLEQKPLLRLRRLVVGGASGAAWDEEGLPGLDDNNQTEEAGDIGGAAVEEFSFSVRGNGDLAREIERSKSQQADELLRPLAQRVRELGSTGAAVGLVAGTPSAAERLAAFARSSGLAAQVLREPGKGETKGEWPAGPLVAYDPARPSVTVLCADLDRGFSLEGALALITEEELFGPKARRRSTPARRVLDPFATQIGELEAGDLIVHTDHGVGRYRGLVRLQNGRYEGDFLLIEYAEKDKLYVPVHRLGRVQKYIGGESAALDKLGGTGWDKVKKKVSKAAKELAEELLRLYAQRQVTPARALPEPDSHFRSFEATFGFTETPDQQSAIDAVLADLQQAHPMDRLVCGDVGYGKTEVAMRAAFQTAMNGGQVAVLVPTTVLAQQHYANFKNRMQRWPLRVEVLSRFVSKPEQQKVMKEASAGKVDILIGTHRLLSQDLKMRSLELLIIDEEQRFGVTHKEKLKKLKAQVHTLTLSATPIPRTLNMAMLGIRDLSIIATAPADRLAVRTFVVRTTDEVIREAITREVNRGGQVFFVHNRVQSLGQITDHLRSILPSVRFGVAHGQMPEGELEKVMVEFVQGAYDVLISTSIIESGIDIPRANTILINRADAFGLAQLYQLRGRVGRSARRAYCYLLVPTENAMTDEAKQRLSVLQRFTELGSGFTVASQDLEIRGAGNLLGDEQSGSAEAVGYELYMELLAEAIAQLKGEEITTQANPEINVDVTALLPSDYVDDVHERLKLYRRLARAEETAELDELSREMVDRFGQLPQEALHLLQVMELQKFARLMNVQSLDVQGERLALRLGESPRLVPEKMFALLKEKDSPYKLSPELRLTRNLPIHKGASDAERLASARQVLQDLWDRASP